jgi:hypothetical protein
MRKTFGDRMPYLDMIDVGPRVPLIPGTAALRTALIALAVALESEEVRCDRNY